MRLLNTRVYIINKNVVNLKRQNLDYLYIRRYENEKDIRTYVKY
jgi:hypothetical protein